MSCFADAAGDILAAALQPVNTAADTGADRATVLGQAIGRLPTQVESEDRPGEPPGTGNRHVTVRAGSAGCTEGFLSACREHDVTFFVVAHSNP